MKNASSGNSSSEPPHIYVDDAQDALIDKSTASRRRGRFRFREVYRHTAAGERLLIGRLERPLFWRSNVQVTIPPRQRCGRNYKNDSSGSHYVHFDVKTAELSSFDSYTVGFMSNYAHCSWPLDTCGKESHHPSPMLVCIEIFLISCPCSRWGSPSSATLRMYMMVEFSSLGHPVTDQSRTCALCRVFHVIESPTRCEESG